MNPNELANSGIVTQLAVVHTMLPKVKELIDNQIAEIEALRKRPAINKEDGLVCAKCYERIGE